MFKIYVNDNVFSCNENTNLLYAARSNRVEVTFACTQGTCGNCKVKVKKGKYKLGNYSKAALNDVEREENIVLLCSTYPLSDLEIEIIS